MADKDIPKASWNGEVTIHGATSDDEVRAIEKRLREQFPQREFQVIRNPAGRRW